MENNQGQQDQQQDSMERITRLEDARARLGAAGSKPVANATRSARRLTLDETNQFRVPEGALATLASLGLPRITAAFDAPHGQDEKFAMICNTILEMLGLPGENMTEDALTEAVVAELSGPSSNEPWSPPAEASMHARRRMRRLVDMALLSLAYEGFLARVETLVVLRSDAPPTKRPGQLSYHGFTPDDIRAVLNEGLLAAGPGRSMDRTHAFSRTNHALHDPQRAHDPAHLEGFATVFDEAIDDLIEEGFLAQVVSYVRLPDAESERVNA